MKTYKVWVNSISIEEYDSKKDKHKNIETDDEVAVCLGEFKKLEDAQKVLTKIGQTGEIHHEP